MVKEGLTGLLCPVDVVGRGGELALRKEGDVRQVSTQLLIKDGKVLLFFWGEILGEVNLLD